MNKAHIVIVGTMFGQKTVHGPFYDMEYLHQWVSICVGNQLYEIVPIDENVDLKR